MAKQAKQAKRSEPPGRILSRANNDFATDIYQALLPEVSSENLIFSPFSLHSVLGMVSQGARGDTKMELIRGLKFQQEDDKTIKESYNVVLNDLFWIDVKDKGEVEDNRKAVAGKKVKEPESERKEGECSTVCLRSGREITRKFPTPPPSPPPLPPPERLTLRTANRVYCKTGFGLNQGFVKDLKQNFLSDFEQLDFHKRREAAGQINRLVENQTNGKIKRLVDPAELDGYTSLVLVNCIYFHGKWASQFSPHATSKANFHVTPKKKVKVDMMYQCTTFPYADLPELDAHVVEMAYMNPGDGRLSMRIILPRAVDGLAKIQNGLGVLRQDGTNLVKNAMAKFRKANSLYQVELYVPKFKIEATIENLNEALQNALGMKTMFSKSRADFGGIHDGCLPPHHNLFVSQVLQKAFISVNEKETEAAAATKIRMQKATKSARPPVQWTYVRFEVDRPFYFEIVDNDNDDLVLFSGHCVHPQNE